MSDTTLNPERRIALFQRKSVRRAIHNSEWWFVVLDVIAALTDSVNPKGYFTDMRRRDPQLTEALKGGGNWPPPLGLEFETAGGRQMLQCWNTEGIFRLIQSIPSPKAEPFKRWLARVGYERVQEIEDPELASKCTRHFVSPAGTNTNSRGCNPRNVGPESSPALKGPNCGGLHVAECGIVRPFQGRSRFGHGSPGFTRRYSCFSPPGWASGGNVAGNARRDLEKKSGRKVVTSGNYLALTQAAKKAKRLK